VLFGLKKGQKTPKNFFFDFSSKTVFFKIFFTLVEKFVCDNLPQPLITNILGPGLPGCPSFPAGPGGPKIYILN
jgi:hypothetical protein